MFVKRIFYTTLTNHDRDIEFMKRNGIDPTPYLKDVNHSWYVYYCVEENKYKLKIGDEDFTSLTRGGVFEYENQLYVYTHAYPGDNTSSVDSVSLKITEDPKDDRYDILTLNFGYEIYKEVPGSKNIFECTEFKIQRIVDITINREKKNAVKHTVKNRNKKREDVFVTTAPYDSFFFTDFNGYALTRENTRNEDLKYFYAFAKTKSLFAIHSEKVTFRFIKTIVRNWGDWFDVYINPTVTHRVQSRKIDVSYIYENKKMHDIYKSTKDVIRRTDKDFFEKEFSLRASEYHESIHNDLGFYGMSDFNNSSNLANEIHYAAIFYMSKKNHGPLEEFKKTMQIIRQENDEVFADEIDIKLSAMILNSPYLFIGAKREILQEYLYELIKLVERNPQYIDFLYNMDSFTLMRYLNSQRAFESKHTIFSEIIKDLASI